MSARIDPQVRWRRHGGKPDYVGLLTFAGLPYTEDAAALAGVDVAIVGAPMDDLVSDRPGTRFSPRGIRAASGGSGPHLDAGIDAFAVLTVVDYGDAACVPAQPRISHEAITEVVGEVLDAGAFPIVLGGDHSIAEPTGRAYAARYGPVGLVHFDAHADTAELVYGAELSHGTAMRHRVAEGHVAGPRYVQVGLRGHWPGEDVFAWQRERGIVDIRMHEVRRRGIDESWRRSCGSSAPLPRTCPSMSTCSRPPCSGRRHRGARAGGHGTARPAVTRAGASRRRRIWSAPSWSS